VASNRKRGGDSQLGKGKGKEASVTEKGKPWGGFVKKKKKTFEGGWKGASREGCLTGQIKPPTSNNYDPGGEEKKSLRHKTAKDEGRKPGGGSCRKGRVGVKRTGEVKDPTGQNWKPKKDRATRKKMLVWADFTQI